VLNVKRDVRGADELRWFWLACHELTEPFGKLLKILLLTGCRLTEISRLRRDELSDDLAMLRLPRNRTKNGRPHDVPLPPLARDIINSAWMDGRAYLFSTNGRTPVSGFSKIKNRLDIGMLALAEKEREGKTTIPPWRLHDLRRTAATGMAGIGIMPHVIEACLNHASGAQGGVAGTYNREQYEPEKRVALERWASHVSGIVSRQTGHVVSLRK
jgi:integrase